MLVVGLTGGIGSGKSTAAGFFAKKGVTVIDADRIARELVLVDTPAYQKICAHFGSKILHDNKTIDRKKLGKHIFQRDDERIWLEKLLHPMIREKMNEAITQATSSYCILVIPLLLETEKNPLINRILVIDAPVLLQQKRTQDRDNRLLDEINAIIFTQMDRNSRLKKADDVIQNDGTLQHLEEQVNALHERYMILAKLNLTRETLQHE